MARTSVKATYALDVDTVQALEKMAQRWAVSKSEALRRAIRAAATEGATGSKEHLDRLGQLQQTLALSPARAEAWVREVRGERRAAPLHSSKAARR
jgi:hypothetical protein